MLLNRWKYTRVGNANLERYYLLFLGMLQCRSAREAEEINDSRDDNAERWKDSCSRMCSAAVAGAQVTQLIDPLMFSVPSDCQTLRGEKPFKPSVVFV